MDDALIIRDADLGDHAALREVLAAAFGPSGNYLTPAVFQSYLADIVALERRSKVAELIVAELEGSVVGGVSFFPSAATEGWGLPAFLAGFRALGVDPAVQGRGIGRALIAECVGRARSRGARGLAVHTAGYMSASLALLQQFGFTRVPEWDFPAADVFAAGNEDEVVVMAFRLDF